MQRRKPLVSCACLVAARAFDHGQEVQHPLETKIAEREAGNGSSTEIGDMDQDADIVNNADVGVIQGRGRPRLPLEPLQRRVVPPIIIRQKLESDAATVAST